MIRYHCDDCGHHIEHQGPDLPREWAAIRVEVDWAQGESGHMEWQADNELLVCPKCRGADGGTLVDRAVEILRAGLKR